MNCRKVFANFAIPQQAKPDIERIRTIWRECRHEHSSRGPWLFGDFSIADAMYAPVAFRFRNYGVPLGEFEQAYVDTVLDDPAIHEWRDASQAESEVIAEDEV